MFSCFIFQISFRRDSVSGAAEAERSWRRSEMWWCRTKYRTGLWSALTDGGGPTGCKAAATARALSVRKQTLAWLLAVAGRTHGRWPCGVWSLWWPLA